MRACLVMEWLVKRKHFRMENYYTLQLVRRIISRGDLGGFITLLFKIIRSKLLAEHRLIFGMVPSALPRHASPIELADYEIKEVSSWDMVDQSIRETFTDYRQYIWWDTESMLRGGRTLWLGYLHGRLANVTWTKTGDRVRTYFFPLTSECVLISYSVTLPEYRGLHLYPAQLVEITRVLASRGFKRFYTGCYDWNIASARGLRRAGFRLIGRGIVKKKGRIIWYPESRAECTHIDTNNKG